MVCIGLVSAGMRWARDFIKTRRWVTQQRNDFSEFHPHQVEEDFQRWTYSNGPFYMPGF